jgi:hypothetical protein
VYLCFFKGGTFTEMKVGLEQQVEWGQIAKILPTSQLTSQYLKIQLITTAVPLAATIILHRLLRGFVIKVNAHDGICPHTQHVPSFREN